MHGVETTPSPLRLLRHGASFHCTSTDTKNACWSLFMCICLRPPRFGVLQLGARRKPPHLLPAGGSSQERPLTPEVSAKPKRKVIYPFASGSGLGNKTLDILSEARGRGAAVGAFTVYNLEGIRAVVGAAEATGRSAILQVSLLLQGTHAVLSRSGAAEG